MTCFLLGVTGYFAVTAIFGVVLVAAVMLDDRKNPPSKPPQDTES